MYLFSLVKERYACVCVCVCVCIHVCVCVLWEGGEEWFCRKVTHVNFLKRFEGLTLEVLVFFFVV